MAAILYFQCMYVAATPCKVWDSLASYTDALWARHAIFPAQSSSAWEARDSSHVYRGHPIMQQESRVVPKHFLVTDFTQDYSTHTCMSDNYTKSKKSVIFHSPFYSRNSPCTHSGKRPAQVKTIFVKPCLTCDLYVVVKSSHKLSFL